MNIFSLLQTNKNVLLSFQSRKSISSLFKQGNKQSNFRFSSSKPGDQQGTYRPSNLERYMLVWMKKFPSVEEVPKLVSNEVMEKTRNLVRIKLNILFCIITGLVCVGMIYSGKAAAKRGENLHKKNIDWHAEINAKEK